MSNSELDGENRSIKIEKDAISSAIISGDGNRVVIYQYHMERRESEQLTPSTTQIGPNPYKGLLAFLEEDGDRYFGREKQVEKLWNLLRTLHENTTQKEVLLRLLPILGPSGCGKSSLVRAGLIPELARHPLPGTRQARVAVLVPGTHPIEALATVLAGIATGDPTPVAKTREFAEELKKQKRESATDTIIYDGLRRIANVLPDIAVSPLLVLVDQFEEVYSLCDDLSERQIFIENLVNAAGDRSGGVSVLITLCSDFLGETQRHAALNQVIGSQGVFVPAMSIAELRLAITKPAVLANHPLDEAVIDLLLKDTEGRVGALPLLQFALTRIWDGLLTGVQPIKTLERIGGVGGALADEAQRIFNTLNSNGQQLAVLRGHQGIVYSVAISTDKQTIVSGGADGTVRLWSSNGQQLAVLRVHQASVLSVGISTDKQTIVSGGADGTVRLWDIQFESWLKTACERLEYHPVFQNPETDDEREAKATCKPYLR